MSADFCAFVLKSAFPSYFDHFRSYRVILYVRAVTLNSSKGIDLMNAPSKEYLFLFNTIVQATEDIRDLQAGVLLLESRLQRLQLELIKAQQTAEELYLESGEENPL